MGMAYLFIGGVLLVMYKSGLYQASSQPESTGDVQSMTLNNFDGRNLQLLYYAVQFNYVGFHFSMISGLSLQKIHLQYFKTYESQEQNNVTLLVLLVWGTIIQPPLLVLGASISLTLEFFSVFVNSGVQLLMSYIMITVVLPLIHNSSNTKLMVKICLWISTISLLGVSLLSFIWMFSKYVGKEFIEYYWMFNIHGWLYCAGFVNFALFGWLVQIHIDRKKPLIIE